MERIELVFFYYLEKAIKTYRQFAQKELKEAGLSITIDQWLVLKCLYENPQISPKALAESVFKDRASITRIIELLVKANYLKRKVDNVDKRKSQLSITNLGYQTIEIASIVAEKYRKKALKDIGIAKEKHVKVVLKTIINNCQ